VDATPVPDDLHARGVKRKWLALPWMHSLETSNHGPCGHWRTDDQRVVIVLMRPAVRRGRGVGGQWRTCPCASMWQVVHEPAWKGSS